MGKCLSVSDSKKSGDISLLSSVPEVKSHDEFQNLQIIKNFPVNPIASSLIRRALTKNHLFNDLSSQDIERLLASVKFCVCDDSKFVFEQGMQGTLFFIINSGQVQVIVDGKKKGILKQEDCFGEMALLSDLVRKASIKTLCKCSFWILSRMTFFTVLQDLFKKSFDQIRKLISGTVFFRNSPDSQIDSISKLAVKECYNDQERIVREGDEGDMLYILKTGCVVFKKGIDEFLRITHIGEMFGEGSLLTGEKRQATCMAMGYTEVISINRLNLKRVFGDNYDEIMMKNVAKNSILSDPHLGFLDKPKVIDICWSLEWKRYSDDEVVIPKKYEQLSMFMVICSGSIKTKELQPSVLRSYQVIGLGNINEKSLKRKDYFSVGQSIVGQISVSDIDQKLKMNTKQMFENLDRIRFITSLSFFQVLSLESIKTVGQALKAYFVTKDTKVFEVGDDSKKLYMVRSGVFEIYANNGSTIRIVLANEIFGERCLYDKKRTASVICVEEGEVFAIHIKTLKDLPEYKQLCKDAKRKEYYQKQITLQSMLVLSEHVIGYGRRKYCIQDPADKNKYDLIIIPKSTLECKLDCYKLVSERNIMIQVDYKHLVKMVCSLVDEHNIYFITEHVKGKPLRNLFPLTQELSKVLILHFVKMLEYLHNKNIVHRDFCVDNIVVSIKGIPHLFNFQSAKMVENRTYSRVGNPYYRSPEMIMGRGYTKSTDIWSLGVVLYEMTYGVLPFKISTGETPVEAYEKILNVKHGIDPSKGEYVNELILGMLSPANKRFDFTVIQRNLWFSSVNKRKIFRQRASQIDDIFQSELKEKKTFKKIFKASRLMTVITTQQLNPIQAQPEVEEFNWAKHF
jgi:cGMP-dependent protein kinase